MQARSHIVIECIAAWCTCLYADLDRMEQPGRAPSGYKLARAKLPAASDAVEEAAPPPPKKRNRVLDSLNTKYLKYDADRAKFIMLFTRAQLHAVVR